VKAPILHPATGHTNWKSSKCSQWMHLAQARNQWQALRFHKQQEFL